MIKTFEQFTDDKYEIKYEKWKKSGYSKGYMAYNLYKNGQILAGVSNDNKDKMTLLIRHLENFSIEKGMATKLLFMLLDMGISIQTGKPNYNSISTTAYKMNRKIVDVINNSNGKYKATILGPANNTGKEDEPKYKDVSGENTKPDNYHYRFELN
jgi:hypothetical protein